MQHTMRSWRIYPIAAPDIISQDQMQHLLDRATDTVGDFLAGSLVTASTPSLSYPLIDERLHLIGKISPDFGSARLGISCEMHQDRNTTMDITRRILLLVEPCHVAFNRFTEPASPYPILSLGF